VQKLAGGALLLSDAAIAGSTVADYLKDRSEFAFANGASPVIGPDAIEALSGRGADAVTAAAPALGVALPPRPAARAAPKPQARGADGRRAGAERGGEPGRRTGAFAHADPGCPAIADGPRTGGRRRLLRGAQGEGAEPGRRLAHRG